MTERTSMAEHPLLTVLRAFVQDTPPQLSLPDPVELVRAAQMQNLLPVLAYMNKKWRLFSEESLNARLNRQLRQTIFIHTQRCAAFEDLSRTLSQAGVDHLPVKGWYLRRLYPVPELRTFGDIDLLIRREDRQAVHNLMLHLGYAAKEDWEPTYSYLRDLEFYEIHTNLMDGSLDGRSDLPAYFAGAWSHARLREGRRWEPELDFHFLYTVCHLAKHLYSSGAGLRMYLDAALYIRAHNDALDWSRIRQEMEHLGLSAFLDTVLTACESWFGVCAGCSFARVEAVDELLGYALDADLFGKLRDHSVIQMRNRRESAGSDGRQSAVKRILFPPYEALVKRYTYIEGRKWLIPVALVHRAAVNVRNLADRAGLIRSIAKADRKAVDIYDDFMTRIGL